MMMHMFWMGDTGSWTAALWTSPPTFRELSGLAVPQQVTAAEMERANHRLL
jgi:hypothetical protein